MDSVREPQNILKVGGHSRELAPDHVMEAMFTTISCRLEPHGQGTRFPAVMDAFHAGYVKPARAAEVLREIEAIEAALCRIPVRDVVWSLANGRRDDTREPVNHGAVCALDYFVGTDGRPLIFILKEGLLECLTTAQVLRVDVPGMVCEGILGCLVCVVAGAAWMGLGRAFFPNWCLRTLYSRSGALPIWTFGMDPVMLGVAFLIASACPAISDWFRRHPGTLMAVVIVLPLAWLVICARAGFLPD